MAITQDVRVQVQSSGPVPPELPELARQKIGAVLRHVSEPVLAARVLLAIAPDPAVARPCIARAMVSVNGRIVRAEAAAGTVRDALDELISRLRVRLERAWPSHRDRGPADGRHRSAGSAANPDERSIVRHATVAANPETPAAAAAELEQLGYYFHLFVDRFSGQDSVIYRAADGYRLAAAGAVPRLSAAEAVTRLESLGQPFVFFTDAATGRGSVLYHRLDGHYGLVVPGTGEPVSSAAPAARPASCGPRR